MKAASLVLGLLGFLISWGNMGVAIAWDNHWDSFSPFGNRLPDDRFVYYQYIVVGISIVGYVAFMVVNLMSPVNRKLDLGLLALLSALSCAVASIWVVWLETLDAVTEFGGHRATYRATLAFTILTYFFNFFLGLVLLGVKVNEEVAQVGYHWQGGVSSVVYLFAMLIQMGNVGTSISWHKNIEHGSNYNYYMYVCGSISFVGFGVLLVQACRQTASRRFQLILLAFLICLQAGIGSIWACLMDLLNYFYWRVPVENAFNRTYDTTVAFMALTLVIGFLQALLLFFWKVKHSFPVLQAAHPGQPVVILSER